MNSRERGVTGYARFRMVDCPACPATAMRATRRPAVYGEEGWVPVPIAVTWKQNHCQ